MVPISALSCAAVLRGLYQLLRCAVPLLLFAIFALGAAPGHAQVNAEGPTIRPMAPPPPSEEGTNGATVYSQAVPSVMIVGRTYNVSVKMLNGGSNEWSSGAGYLLASRSPDWNTTWGVNQIGMDWTIVPYWGTYTFNFQVTAPTSPGTYTFEWGMFHTSSGWFGYTSPLAITVREPINNAELLGQNVPGQVRTGQRHEVVIVMRNNGETTWTRAQQYTLMAQSPHNNITWGLNRVPLSVETVNPGESATFRFEVTAPATAGQYVSQWGMQREGYGSFGGSSVPVTVNVTEPVNNAQPTGQSVPAQMETGKPYTVSVTMVNNGETTWNRAQQYTLMAQSPHNNTTGVSTGCLCRSTTSPRARARRLPST